MQAASFTGFIKTVFIIFFIYYAFKIIFRIFFPIILQNILKKVDRNFREHYGQYNQQNSSSQDYVKTDQSRFQKPKESNKEGDYIDYEEIN